MKKTPKPIKPDVVTYFIAKRMETAGMLKPGQALMLAATAGLKANNTKKPRNYATNVKRG